MGRHAYLILAHSNFEQLKILLSLLDDGRNDIFVHLDKKITLDESLFKGICKNSTLVFLKNRKKISWGGVNMIRAEVLLLEEARAFGQYSYYHLLSGMDLPIKTQDYIHKFFEKNDGREFVSLWPLRKKSYSRFYYYTLFPEGAGSFLTNYINNLVKAILISLNIRINKNIEFKYSSQWFSISDKFAEYILSKKEWIETVFKHTCICDEIFLATLLHNSEFKHRLYYKNKKSQKENSYDKGHNFGSMRLIDWSRGSSSRHPWTFREDDWEMLVDSSDLWARKFDERVDSKIIERIYNKLKSGKELKDD